MSVQLKVSAVNNVGLCIFNNTYDTAGSN